MVDIFFVTFRQFSITEVCLTKCYFQIKKKVY